MKQRQVELSNVSTKMEEEHKLNLEKDSRMALLRQKFQVHFQIYRKFCVETLFNFVLYLYRQEQSQAFRIMCRFAIFTELGREKRKASRED